MMMFARTAFTDALDATIAHRQQNSAEMAITTSTKRPNGADRVEPPE